MKLFIALVCILSLVCCSIGASVDIQVSKDAQVTYQSKGCPYPTCPNLGSSPTIVIGNYEITSEGYFGFDLSTIPANAAITSATLKLPSGTSPVGSQPITLSVYQIVDNDAWSESTIIWDNKPSFHSTALGTSTFIAPGPASPLDVTQAVSGATSSGSIGFRVIASLNVFLNSKESSSGGAVLSVEYTPGSPQCNCPDGMECCGEQCYSTGAYTCFSGVLCPYGTMRCGENCYSPSSYECFQPGDRLCPRPTVPCGLACINLDAYQCCNGMVYSKSQQC